MLSRGGRIAVDTLHLVAGLFLVAVLAAITWHVARCELARRTARLEPQATDPSSTESNGRDAEAA